MAKRRKLLIKYNKKSTTKNKNKGTGKKLETKNKKRKYTKKNRMAGMNCLKKCDEKLDECENCLHEAAIPLAVGIGNVIGTQQVTAPVRTDMDRTIHSYTGPRHNMSNTTRRRMK